MPRRAILWRAEIHLPADATSPSTARRFVDAVLRSWDSQELVDDACVVVSELVTNAVVHARSAPVVRLARVDERLRVEVLDGCALEPSVRHDAADPTRGRGLPIVDALSVRWGTTVDPGRVGKLVWCELATRQPLLV